MDTSLIVLIGSLISLLVYVCKLLGFGKGLVIDKKWATILLFILATIAAVVPSVVGAEEKLTVVLNTILALVGSAVSLYNLLLKDVFESIKTSPRDKVSPPDDPVQ